MCIRDSGSATDRIASVRAGHRAWRKLVHDRGAPNDGRQRERAADPLAATNHIGNNTVMVKGPELACPTEPGLDLVENQDHFVLPAPVAQLTDVFDRSKVRPYSLIS